MAGEKMSTMGDVTSVRPRMDNEIHNVTVIEGHEAILPCVVNNIGRHQVKVVWLDKWKTVLTLNENRIIDDDRFKVDLPRDGQWNLHFDKVKYGDQGMFTCQINTEPAMSQTVALSVIVPPRIISDPIESTLIYREGDRVTLTCNATGMPKPTVRWYRQPSVRGETRESESCTTLPRIGYAGEILQIHNVTRHCGGVYECEADNEVAPSVRKATVVKVKFQPEVVVASERIAQSIGKDTILECTITGYPQAEAAWKFGSKQLSNSEKHKLEVFPYNDDENKLSLYLNIKDIQRSDFGDYFCFASNDMGEASDRMVLEEYKIKKTTSPSHTTTMFTTSVYHSLNSRANQPPHNHINQFPSQKSKGRNGVVLEKNEIINTNTEKRKQQTSRPEASLHILGKNSGAAMKLSLLCCSINVFIMLYALIFSQIV
ncbi:hypothetical protein Btru_076288 [Bulinus truncatus]|nr:hypothetical protein Btru_076288 [Bulinus truncatus]